MLPMQKPFDPTSDREKRTAITWRSVLFYENYIEHMFSNLLIIVLYV